MHTMVVRDLGKCRDRGWNPTFYDSHAEYRYIQVIQEVAIATEFCMYMGRTVYHGQYSRRQPIISKSHRSGCCSRFVASMPRDQTKVIEDFCDRIMDITALRTRLRTPGRIRLLSLLQLFRDRRATDPRDKVYALLGLSRAPISKSWKPGKKQLIPDYTLSEAEAFRQATLECIHQETSLSVLSTDLGRKFRNDLPSWVPDWGAPGSISYGLRAAAVDLYQATCLSKEEAIGDIIQAVHDKLMVPGLRHGKLTAVDEVTWDDSPTMCRVTLSNWKPILSQVTLPDLGTFDPRRQRIYWKILCGDVIHFHENHPRDFMRPRDQSEGTYEVIGDGYLQDTLYGKEIKKTDVHEWKTIALV